MQSIYRLKKNKHFNYIYKTGKSMACKNIILIYAKNNSGKLKCGFSVSKKIGKSVVRNRIKRRMKEAFRELIPSADHSYNYIFIARAQCAQDGYAEIKKSLLYLLKKQGLLIGTIPGASEYTQAPIRKAKGDGVKAPPNTQNNPDGKDATRFSRTRTGLKNS